MSREEEIRIRMEALNIEYTEAAFIVAMERGEIGGDVIATGDDEE